MRTLTKELQAALTPLQGVQLLKDGNHRFVSNLRMNRDLLRQVNETSEGQHPFAVILSCIDSRTSAELIFDQGLGDVFSVRIAGNVLNEDILGSMEFACRVAGAKVVVVLGHRKCGAIKGACDGVQLGNLTALLGKVVPAVRAERSEGGGGMPADAAFVDRVAARNVRMQMRQIVERSPILGDMLGSGSIVLVGGMYDVTTGVVEFLD